MKNIYLISLQKNKSFEKYNQSIKNQININSISKLKDKKSRKVSIWELNRTKDNEKIWKEVKKHDILMFFRNGKIFSKAKIISKSKESNITKQEKKSQMKKLFLYFHSNKEINISQNATYTIFMNPLMPEAYDFPILKIDEKKMKPLTRVFQDIEEVIDFLGEPENKDKPISDIINSKKIKNTKVTSKKVLKNQREGQERFRKNI